MLHIDAVTKTYPGVRALDRATLDIGPGVFGLLGPNGAGKTTLMEVIATLLEPDADAVSFDGVDFRAEKRSARRLLGYLPQDFGFYPTLTAKQTLDYFARLKGIGDPAERSRCVSDLLERVGLDSVRDDRVDTFSGGMRQRLGIAQALLASPRLIVVDEPTAGLDPEERNRFHDLLAEAALNDVVVLLSTHIVVDVANVCSRFAIIRDGRILRVETPPDAIAQMRGSVWEATISKSELQMLPAEVSIIAARRAEEAVHVRAFSAGGAPSPAFNAVEPALEDYYFAVIGNDQVVQ